MNRVNMNRGLSEEYLRKECRIVKPAVHSVLKKL